MISETTIRLVAHIHGHIGWLAVAALLHPAIVLRKPMRRAPLAVFLATMFVSFAGMLGASIYPRYGRTIKPLLFEHAPTLGWMFERKEHLAVAAVGFAWVGCIAHLTARSAEDRRVATRMAILAHRAYVFAFAASLTVACIGVAVSVHRSFP